MNKEKYKDYANKNDDKKIKVNERKIEVISTPHYWDNEYSPYHWMISTWSIDNKVWFNESCGWGKTIGEAFKMKKKKLEILEKENPIVY